MKLSINDLTAFHEYFNQVMTKAKHHAKKVEDVVLSIAGAIILKSTEIKVLEREGEIKNALWFTVNSKKYALSYVHDKGIIELRKGNLQGEVVTWFDNTSTSNYVRTEFERL